MAPRDKSKAGKKAKASNKTPAFDEKALLQLTNKLDQSLSKTADDQSRPGKRKRQDDHEKRAKPKKRSSDAHENGDQDKNATLLEDIKALGGDENDLELVIGIDSDAEEGVGKSGDRPLDDSFKSELVKFASALGFDQARAELDDESFANEEEEASEEEDEETEEEDAQDQDDSEDEQPEQPKLREAVEKTPAPAKDPFGSTIEKPEKLKNRQWAGKLTLEPRPDWHAAPLDSLPDPESDDVSKFTPAIGRLKAHAQALVEADAAVYNTMISSSSQHKFMTTIMSSGTLSDKISALTLAVQESPVHNIKSIDTLINMAGKKSRGQALAALGALVDLLGNGVVLPGDRRLRPFHAQPGLLGTLQQKSVYSWRDGQSPLPGKISKVHLMMWYFEDWLKSAYFRVLQVLEVWAGDEIDYSRSRTLDFVFGLLRDKPEQEANLMRLLVSKLGDREGKIASRASYLLLQLVNTHPGMKPIVMQTIEQEVLLRPGQSLKSKYHAINTLNQTILSNKEPELADNLVRIYFDVFLALLKTGSLGIFDHLGAPEEDSKASTPKKGRGKKPKQPVDPVTANEQDVAQKLVSAVLTGVNRAIPFAMTNESTLETHLDTLFRITHSSNFNTSVQALILIQQIAASKQLAVDRFYRTLYESLLDPRLVTSSKQTLYLNLLYKSLKNDVDVRRVKAFVKRMLQIVNLHQPSFICGILYLIAELEGVFPDLKALLNDPEDNEDDSEEVYRDADAVESGKKATEVNGSDKKKTAYDGRKRHPEYSNAHRSCLWEIAPFFEHFHPSVVVFANNLLARQKSLPKPELSNHTLIQFLDKFVYRNAKTTEITRGGSIMQPVVASGTAANAASSGKTQRPTVNSETFWNLKSKDVAAEDVFFHEYFSQVGKPGQISRAAKREQKRAQDGAQDDEEEEGEDEIWQALVDSRPEIQGDDDGYADMGFSDGDDDDLGSLLEDMSDSDEDEDMLGAEQVDVEGDEGVVFNDFSESEGETEGGAPLDEAAEAKRLRNKASREKKKQMKALPTFASADDYAHMLAQEEDEDYN
ncbi:hypothetical protein MCOR02_008135 [Pyricularia oryzae]|nr:hypothetical protein MCOR02_008135 [Pyricularia oryzae]KAI6320676.1 hypothetical protein MCOR34_002901 [Pyricularia oryzae]KAI6472983.1 hypothetical protein MCOR17_002793 [Pyricularia oryzae]KAI6508322.1 hypothetical protein MCOR13_002301 [Pyricularia oryzae]KAI6555325.1 hypothetical protein MCOR04_010454 [Pyricularia oryzae]